MKWKKVMKALGMLVLVCSLVACGKQSEEIISEDTSISEEMDSFEEDVIIEYRCC